MASNGSTNESVMGPKLPSARVHELSQLQCKGVMPRARATSICVEAETTVSHMTMRWGGGGRMKRSPQMKLHWQLRERVQAGRDEGIDALPAVHAVMPSAFARATRTFLDVPVRSSWPLLMSTVFSLQHTV